MLSSAQASDHLARIQSGIYDPQSYLRYRGGSAVLAQGRKVIDTLAERNCMSSANTASDIVKFDDAGIG